MDCFGDEESYGGGGGGGGSMRSNAIMRERERNMEIKKPFVPVESTK